MELEFILHLTVWWCDVSKKKPSAVLVSRVKINCILHLNVNEGLWRPLQAEENLFIIVAFIHTDKKCSSVVANIPKIIFATPRCLKMTQIVLFELFVLLKLPCLVILLLTTSRKIDHAIWKSPKLYHLNFSTLAFSTIFCPIKVDTAWPQVVKLTFLRIFVFSKCIRRKMRLFLWFSNPVYTLGQEPQFRPLIFMVLKQKKINGWFARIETIELPYKKQNKSCWGC